MPKPYPRAFRDDVVRVARSHEDGITLEQVAHGFEVHPMTLNTWRRQDRIDTGERARMSTSWSAELRELRRRNRLLEQEVEVLRRAAAYLSQTHLTRKGSTRS